MSEIEESARAVQEASKLGREMVAKLGHLETIGRQLLGPFGEGYGILTDLVRHKREEINWRLENRRKIYALALKRAEELEIELEKLRTVPNRIAYEYEDGLEREDDDTLQNLWANLLINVTNPTTDLRPARTFKEILCRLDPDDAIFMNEIGIRRNIITSYFIVAGTDRGGTQINPIPYGYDKSHVLMSTDLFKYSELDTSYYVTWSEDKIISTVDKLQSIGLMYWDKELVHAGDMLEQNEALEPSRNYVELGKRVLAESEGVRVFKISGLGRDFVEAVSPPS